MGKKRGRPRLTKDQKIERVFKQLTDTERRLRVLEKDFKNVTLPSLKSQIEFQIVAVKYRRNKLREELNQLAKDKG